MTRSWIIAVSAALASQWPSSSMGATDTSPAGQMTSAAPVATTLQTNQNDVLLAKKQRLLLWKISLRGESFADDKDQAQTTGFGLAGQYRQVLLTDLLIRVKANVSLQTGYSQSRFGDDTPKSGVFLSEAILQYKPFSFFSFQAGALDQSILDAPLLVSPRPFPGVAQKIMVGSRSLGAELIVQEVTPTSTSLSTKTTNSEPTPYLFTQTLIIKAQPADFSKLKAFGTHYSFRQLPSSVAFESQKWDNSVTGDAPSDSRFDYGFDGWVVGGESKLRLVSGVSWNIDSHILQNSLAPTADRSGQWIQSGFDFELPRDIDFQPRAAVFFAESDIAPAYYNSSELGHGNRQGLKIATDLIFKRDRFKIGAAYISSKVINESIFQSREQFLQLYFETLYENL